MARIREAKWKSRMTPFALDEIELCGYPPGRARRAFAKPQLAKWNAIHPFWRAKEI
jgi:hypothetical protein